MDFSLTEEQEALHGLSAQIFADRAKPDRVEEVEATDERFDRALWSDLARAGLLGVALPVEHGGLGLGMVELSLVCEALGRTVAPVAMVWTATAALTLATHGSAEQQQRWLTGVASGDALLTSALPQCVGVIDVEGGAITGTLTGVPVAHIAAALLVPAGGALYVVDLTGPGCEIRPGVAIDRQVHCEVVLDGASGEQVGGLDAAEWLWQRTVVALAAVQSGVTDGALRMAADYTSSREQFGKPLSTFQGVALKAADGYIDNAAIRATMLQAAWQLDRGGDATAAVLTATWWAAEAGQRCVHITQHLHGGIGADITYPVHRYFLWGKQIELMVGGASATLARLGDVLDSVDSPGDAQGLFPS